MKNSQARTGHQRGTHRQRKQRGKPNQRQCRAQRGMGGRGTDDDDTHEQHTDTNKLTRQAFLLNSFERRNEKRNPMRFVRVATETKIAGAMVASSLARRPALRGARRELPPRVPSRLTPQPALQRARAWLHAVLRPPREQLDQSIERRDLAQSDRGRSAAERAAANRLRAYSPRDPQNKPAPCSSHFMLLTLAPAAACALADPKQRGRGL